MLPATTTQGDGDDQSPEPVTFPPAAQWYKSNAASSRDDMWAYLGGQMIVLVIPKVTLTKTVTTCDPIPRPEGSRIWPKFDIFGHQREHYSCLSFCQSGWDFLPVKNAPLVTACKEGYTRIWNVRTGQCIMYNDLHKQKAGKNINISCVDWSVRNPAIIYSMDEDGTLVVWHLRKAKLKHAQFGKIVPTCLQSSPHEDNIIAFGTKAGLIFIAFFDASGKSSAKILHKVRHEEEIVATLWCPKLDWRVSRSDQNMGPVFASSVQSIKPPSIRLWSRKVEDRGIYEPWEKETRGVRAFRNFSPLFWATDPNSGDPMLITSSKTGEIISYTSEAVMPELLHNLHNHSSIFCLVQCGDVLWSISYEPVIIGWNLRTMTVSCVIPTFKGICSIAPSPSVGNVVAIGGSDAAIRVINFDKNYPHRSCFKEPSISQRLRSKIMALAWHPTRDNVLGYGTDDGVLGIFELRESQRHAMNFDRRVGGSVYSVDWGPSVYFKEFQNSEPEDKKETFELYACGANTVYKIHPGKMSNLLVNVSKLIDSTNPHSLRFSGVDATSNSIASKATDIRWSPDFKIFVVGYNDGRVELYSPPFLQLKCWIKCHSRAIQYLSWRPYDFAQQLVSAEHKERWFATCSNDGTARLFNLDDILDEEVLSDESREPTLYISSAVTLRSPNGERILSTAWSPHDPNIILTVSYDKTGVVWNVKDGTPVARYFGHKQRLVACMFHPTQEYSVISSSDECMFNDSTIHVWDYREHPFQSTAPSVPKLEQVEPLHVKSKEQIVLENEPKNDVEEMVDTNVSDTINHVHMGEEVEKSFKEMAVGPRKKAKTKAGSRSLLPATANVFINSKHTLETEIRYLVKAKKDISNDSIRDQPGASGEPKTNGDTTDEVKNGLDKKEELEMIHLGLLGDFDQCLDLVQTECKSHGDKGDWEKGCLLAFWAGDTSFVEKAVQQGHVTETIVHCTKTLSKKLYTQACETFAENLLVQDEISKAATYFLMGGNKEKALQVLIDNKLYRDAIVMLKMTTTRSSPLRLPTLKKWLIQLISDGNFEVAAKIYCSIGLYGDALTVIEKRDTPYAWKTGMFLASKCSDFKKMQVFGLKYVVDCVMKGEHKEAKEAANSYEGLKWLLVFALAHEEIFNLSNKIRDASKGPEVTVPEMEYKFKSEVEKGCDLEELKKDGAVEKLKQSILISVAQNKTDAEIILIRTLSLIILDDEGFAESPVDNCLSLAAKWFEEKDKFQHAAYVMALNNIA